MQGSTTSILDEDGAGELSYEYDDFGETEVNGNSVFRNENCYTGGIYDETTGLYYLNARYYDPENGRFLTEDTYRGELNEPDTLHLYAYCKNNPINYVDPSGHIPYAVYGGIKAIFGSVSLSGMLPIAAVCVGTFLLIAGYHRWGAKIKQEIQKKISIAILKAVVVANSTVAYIKGLTISLARAKSIVRKRMTEKHHIVPRNSGQTKNARAALKNARIDINSKKNTIILDYRFHKTLHRKTYYVGIENVIGGVKNNIKAVRGRLTAIKTTLKVANAYISKF